MLPIFPLQSDITADASHLLSPEENGSKSGSGTGAAHVQTIVPENKDSVEPDNLPPDSLSGSSAADSSGNYNSDSSSDPSRKSLILILVGGAAVVIGAVALFIKGRW